MGRGGGSSHSSGGGGGHSFSGGHSSHGFSGGWGGGSSHRGGGSSPSKSSGGLFGGSTRSSNKSRPSYNHTNVFVNNSPRYNNYGRPPRYAHSNNGRGGCLNFIISFIVIVFIIWLMLGMLNESGYLNPFSNSSSNAITREKLDDSILQDRNAVIQDKVNWLDNESKVKDAMNYFRDKTGVQPSLIICDEINGKKDFSEDEVHNYLETEYKKFPDEAHLILLFCEPYESQYYRAILTGTAADTVIDNQAKDIVYKYIDKYYYYDSFDDNEYFAAVFKDSANQIMKKVTNPNDVAKSGIKYLGIIFIVIIGGIIFVKVRKIKAKEKQAAADILNSNLNDLTSPEQEAKDKTIQDLENKYK